MKKIYLSWLEVDRMIFNLTEKVLLSKKKFNQVVGVANGGLYISNKIAQSLGISHKTIKISHYDGMIHRSSPVVELADFSIKNSLIVDDLIDNGGTMQTIQEHYGLENNETAVLFWNVNSINPTYYVEEKPDAWLVFPWEAE